MAVAKTTEQEIIKLENKHPEMLFADSEADGLYYVTCEDDDRIAILCGGGRVILTIEQSYALTRELMSMHNLFFGRCRKNGQDLQEEKRGRKKKSETLVFA